MTSPWVVTQPSNTMLVAQPAPVAQPTQILMMPNNSAKEEKEEESQPPAGPNSVCECIFALCTCLLLIIIAGYWTTHFLLTNQWTLAMEAYKSSSITWGFQNFQTKLIPAQFIPIGLKYIWWIILGASTLIGMIGVACHNRCCILLISLVMLVNLIFFIILTADEGQIWGNAETKLKDQWNSEISSSTVNFRATGLCRIMYEFQCCGVDNGCTDFGTTKDSFWLNATVGTGCFTANCNTPCARYIGRVKNSLMMPFIATLLAMIMTLFLFLSALCMANQMAHFTGCFAMGPVEEYDE